MLCGSQVVGGTVRKLEALLEQSSDGVRGGASVDTAAGRKQWWQARMKLDQSLRDLLHRVESEWLGTLSFLLLGEAEGLEPRELEREASELSEWLRAMPTEVGPGTLLHESRRATAVQVRFLYLNPRLASIDSAHPLTNVYCSGGSDRMPFPALSGRTGAGPHTSRRQPRPPARYPPRMLCCGCRAGRHVAIVGRPPGALFVRCCLCAPKRPGLFDGRLQHHHRRLDTEGRPRRRTPGVQAGR